MNKYYHVIGTLSGRTEYLFGSFVKQDCTYELDAEKESWKAEGYKNIKIISKETEEKPDPTVYNLKYSTFYTKKEQKRVYTTIKLTQHHQYLRESLNGETYQHDESAALYFVEGMPLDTPIPYFKQIK